MSPIRFAITPQVVLFVVLIGLAAVFSNVAFSQEETASASPMVLYRRGATMESERALSEALDWLARHQRKDGSWSFDHNTGPCKGRCDHSGSVDAPNAATAMALLAFLRAGKTPDSAEHGKTVQAGLDYLKSKFKMGDERTSFEEPGGTMYSHGLCTLALCEAYAHTHARDLKPIVQAAVNHTIFAQDPVGGGWRYRPRQPGDTSVTGWQVHSLYSARSVMLDAPDKIFTAASEFLDSVQADDGAAYGYTTPGKGLATTAIGLSCRILGGWGLDRPSLLEGAALLASRGVSRDNFYHNYYASQVMYHLGGESWEKWNTNLRDQLVARQATEGHAQGSYSEDNSYGARAGRHYCTTLAALCLAIYRQTPRHELKR